MANTLHVQHQQLEECADGLSSACVILEKTYMGDHDGPVAELIVH